MVHIYRLPPELMKLVTDELDFASHMSLILTSRTLFGMLPEVRAKGPRAWIRFNLNFERNVPPRRQLTLLTCTECAKLKPRAVFSDSQRRKTCYSRFCIECGIKFCKYVGTTRSFRVGGVPMFACAACCKALPESEEASYGCDSVYTEKGRWCERCWEPISAYLHFKNRGPVGLRSIWDGVL